MVRAFSHDAISGDAPTAQEYEQPLTERMRTFLRLEFLYQQLLYNTELDADWATRAATASLLDIVAILSRGDVRSDILKALDHNLDSLRRFQSLPEVDTSRLNSLVATLEENRGVLQGIGNHFLQPLKDNEFLNAIKHRSSIPGGTCEFDLPVYSHWLRLPYERRQEDFAEWLGIVRPICDAVTELLWLVREISPRNDRRAINGMYQHAMQKNSQCQMLRIVLPQSNRLYPEISGSHHRFTVRFMEWSAVGSRAVQTGHDVDFQLSVC